MKRWLLSITRRTPDQVLVCACGALFLLVASYDLHKTLYRVYAPTGVLMRVEGIETQLNATTKNTKQITADIKDATATWKEASKAQADFFNGALPGLTGQLQNNLDALYRTQTEHLQPAVDRLGASAKALGDAADGLGDVAAATTATLGSHVNPLLDSAKRTLDSGKAALDGFTRLETAPDLYAALHEGAGMAEDGHAVTAAARKRLVPLLDPPPCSGAKCRWVRAWDITHTVLGVGAPTAYYLTNIK